MFDVEKLVKKMVGKWWENGGKVLIVSGEKKWNLVTKWKKDGFAQILHKLYKSFYTFNFWKNNLLMGGFCTVST